MRHLRLLVHPEHDRPLLRLIDARPLHDRPLVVRRGDRTVAWLPADPLEKSPRPPTGDAA